MEQQFPECKDDLSSEFEVGTNLDCPSECNIKSQNIVNKFVHWYHLIDFEWQQFFYYKVDIKTFINEKLMMNILV